jgi:hypothetical protein
MRKSNLLSIFILILFSFGVGGTRPDSRLPPSRKETENNQTLEGDELGE